MNTELLDRDPHLEAVNLYRGPRDGVRELAAAYAEAPSPGVLSRRAADGRALALRLLDEGMAASHLTRIIAELNDILTRRLLELIARRHRLDDLRWAWLALGSEGRLEQTLYTDQDNAIVFDGGLPADAPADAVREAGRAIQQRLLPFAREVNHALADCGFRLCPGDIMAGNPKWCGSFEQWQRRFADWIDAGDPEALLHGAIFFDFRPLHGEIALVEKLRRWLSAYVGERPLFLRQMSENALRNRSRIAHMGPWTRLPGWQVKPFDVKRHGVSPFTDAARILALGRGLPETHTGERLGRWARTDSQKAQARSWTRAFEVLQDYRLQRQAECLRAGTDMDNLVAPERLSHFDRAVLRAALREARDAQRHLAIRYQIA